MVNKQAEGKKTADAWLFINRNSELMFKSGDGDTIHHIKPAELMDAIRSIKGERVLNIKYAPEVMKTVENWKEPARQTGNLKINLIEIRYPNRQN